MIKVVYKKPLKEDSQIIFYIDNNILTATVYNSFLKGNDYYLYFDNNHISSIKILESYFENSLCNIFKLIAVSTIIDAAWPYTTLEDLEKILDNFSILEEL